MGVAKRIPGAIGKFFLMWAGFVARIILLFWHYGSSPATPALFPVTQIFQTGDQQ